LKKSLLWHPVCGRCYASAGKKDSSLDEKDSSRIREEVIRGILRYVAEHPDAKDTVEGIVKWWRLGDEVEWAENPVQEALDILISKGWLVKRDIAPLKSVYGVNKDHLGAIKNFLRASGNE
jgi:hypothetical protein